MPEKEQFQSGEDFYGTLFHEMVHSTGDEGVLDRLQPTSFGSKEYAREELLAELGSAPFSYTHLLSVCVLHILLCYLLLGWVTTLVVMGVPVSYTHLSR